jgi:beta-alanine--pyruvate transaminase
MDASNLDALTRDALDYFLFPLASKEEIRTQGPMIFTSSDGMEITDAGGKTYLDMMSCHTRAGSLGYGEERIARAIYDQLVSLHYAGTIANVVDVTVNLSAKMAELAPGSLTSTVFAGSGSEANEMSIKLARQYHIAKGDKPHAHKVISRWNAYHGATMGAIGCTDYLGTRAITEPGVPGYSRVPAPNLYRTPFGMDPSEVCDYCVDFLEQHIVHEGPEMVSAFIAEPVMQGDGVQVPPDDYFARVREVCDKYDVILIGDEVITGFGRVGAAFASERFGVTPDMMTTAKGLTNGTVPASAVVMQKEIYDTFMTGPDWMVELTHGYTYSAHPLAVAAGLATLDLYRDEGLFERSAALSPVFEDAVHSLKGLPNVIDVRNIGMMGAVEFAPRGGEPGRRGYDVFLDCWQSGVYCRQAGDTLAFSPPFIIEEGEIGQIFEIVADAIRRTD